MRRRNSGCIRDATLSTHSGGSFVVVRLAPTSGTLRVYMKPCTNRAATESTGAPISANTRRVPDAIPVSMSHREIGVVPPG